ncbi:MAG: hypothetical protein HEEMFOPI_01521 [Holosporales bacterium]
MSNIKKSKFTLTPDLVSLERDTIIDDSIKNNEKLDKTKKTFSSIEKEQFNMRINSKTKRNFQIWCIENGKQMSDVVEDLIEKMLEENRVE